MNIKCFFLFLAGSLLSVHPIFSYEIYMHYLHNMYYHPVRVEITVRRSRRAEKREILLDVGGKDRIIIVRRCIRRYDAWDSETDRYLGGRSIAGKGCNDTGLVIREDGTMRVTEYGID